MPDMDSTTYQFFKKTVNAEDGVLMFMHISDIANHGNPFRIAVTSKGICINGDYGTNPTAEEMREMVEVMRECVKWYEDVDYGDENPEDFRYDEQ